MGMIKVYLNQYNNVIEMHDWLEKNAVGSFEFVDKNEDVIIYNGSPYVVYLPYFEFESEEDAVAFRLTWL